MSQHFQLLILQGDWSSLGLGYDYAQAWPRLVAARKEPLFALTVDDIDVYDWNTQRIRLTAAATDRLLRCLETAPGAVEWTKAVNAMRASLGWGGACERALYTRGFIVTVDDQPRYGGIFLDASSAMAIAYPVVRAGLASDGRAVFSILPVHMPFMTSDPSGADANELVMPQAAADWRQLAEEMKRSLAEGGDDRAMALRGVIRAADIRAVLAEKGKLGEIHSPE